MRITSKDNYKAIASILGGRKILYYRGGIAGNAGSKLTHAGTMAFFADHDVEILNCWEQDEVLEDDRADYLVYGGGATMGTLYPEKTEERRLLVSKYCDNMGIPVIVLPSSHSGVGHEDRPPLATIFAREKWTQGLLQNAPICPDMSMYLDLSNCCDPNRQHGVFLRADADSRMRKWAACRCLIDPVDCGDYLKLACQFESLTTDRLMLAIAGLLLSRKVTLLPNASQKNRSYYDTWLKDSECCFMNALILS